MKNKFTKTMVFSAAILAMFMAAQISVIGQEISNRAVPAPQNWADRLVGVWETTVTPRNCVTGEQVAPSFIGLITFHQGGTLSEYGANPAAPFRTPGHGVWQRGYRGEGSYLFDFTFIPLTPAGAPVGRLAVTQTLEIARHSDNGSSSGSFQLTNTSGVVIGTGCTTSTATKF